MDEDAFLSVNSIVTVKRDRDLIVGLEWPDHHTTTFRLTREQVVELRNQLQQALNE